MYQFLYIVPLLLVVGFLNYNPQMLFGNFGYYHWGWQCSLLATLVIIGFFRYRERTHWKELLGIGFKARDVIAFLLLTSVIVFASYWLIKYIVISNGYSFNLLLTGYNQFDNLKGLPFHAILSSYLYYIPQTFNEEMIVGALLLFSLKRRFKSANNLTIAALVALVFSLMHQAMYKYSPVQPGELLTVTTLTSLFLVGVLRNLLILRSGKITYAWAIHLSWNLLFFTTLILLPNGEFASEPRRFNLILGDSYMLAIIGVATILVAAWPWVSLNMLGTTTRFMGD